MGKAFELIQQRAADDKKQILALREKLKEAMLALKDVSINGSQEHHLPGILSVTFKGIDSHMPAYHVRYCSLNRLGLFIGGSDTILCTKGPRS